MLDAKYYEEITGKLISMALDKGAEQVEISGYAGEGFTVEVRNAELDRLEHQQDREVTITVYQHQAEGQVTISDLRDECLQQAIEKATAIAKHTQADPCNGLADKALVQNDYPQCDIDYPWHIDPEQAIALAVECEELALSKDKRITQAESVDVNHHRSLSFYGNSNDFIGSYFATDHYINCSLIAEHGQQMQRDGYYSTARCAGDLFSTSKIADIAVDRVVQRLDAKPISTRQSPVIFSAEIARSVLGHLVEAIAGSSLYRQTSFLLDKLNHKIFPDWVNVFEQPQLAKAMASRPFDADGVVTQEKHFIQEGSLVNYVLGSYSARKLGMQTTANAGGVFNLCINHNIETLDDLIQEMQTGLIVTEVMGQGVNITTGDYSRGASGLWVENGKIQHAVQEVTIAGNLLEIYQNLIAVANDVDRRGSICSGSWLIDSMTIAGT